LLTRAGKLPAEHPWAGIDKNSKAEWGFRPVESIHRQQVVSVILLRLANPSTSSTLEVGSCSGLPEVVPARFSAQIQAACVNQHPAN